MPDPSIRVAVNDELLKGDNLPDENQIVRYVRPSLIEDDGSAQGSAFTLRPSETNLSVNRLEAFAPPKKNQLGEVCRLIRMSTSPNGRFAEMNVGNIRQRVSTELNSLRIVHAPLEEEDDRAEDPSHALILNLPPGESDHGMAIGDLMAECVSTMHELIIARKLS